jgi:hypothetical protein
MSSAEFRENAVVQEEEKQNFPKDFIKKYIRFVMITTTDDSTNKNNVVIVIVSSHNI